MVTQKKLTKNQKESIFLLQIGTFLEYFDLMLYVHMAVVLNELFFPPSDPKTTALLSAFAFCSIYVLRPFGALIFGYIGDAYGRKPTIIITTGMMALSSFFMASMPTYANIGITAAIMVSVLRIVQGMTSMGEIMGARIYISEITKPPMQYSAVSSVTIASVSGSMFALGIATLVTRSGFNWRYAFLAGAVVALIGITARTRLRETPDFADARRRRQKAIEEAKEQGLKKPAELLASLNKMNNSEKVKIRHFLHYISLYAGWPFCFCLGYMTFIPVLKSHCGYSSADVIAHNLYLVIFEGIAIISLVILSKRIYPLFIVKYRTLIFILVIIVLPFFVNSKPNQYYIFAIQTFIVMFGLSVVPADAIFIKHFPIFSKFTTAAFGCALSHALMYIIVSFGLVYLTEWFGYFGIWVIAFPLVFFWLKAVKYYENLEKEVQNYPINGELQFRPHQEPFDD